MLSLNGVLLSPILLIARLDQAKRQSLADKGCHFTGCATDLSCVSDMMTWIASVIVEGPGTRFSISDHEPNLHTPPCRDMQLSDSKANSKRVPGAGVGGRRFATTTQTRGTGTAGRETTPSGVVGRTQGAATSTKRTSADSMSPAHRCMTRGSSSSTGAPLLRTARQKMHERESGERDPKAAALDTLTHLMHQPGTTAFSMNVGRNGTKAERSLVGGATMGTDSHMTGMGKGESSTADKTTEV